MVSSSQSSHGINVSSVIGGAGRASLSAERQCRRSERNTVEPSGPLRFFSRATCTSLPRGFLVLRRGSSPVNNVYGRSS